MINNRRKAVGKWLNDVMKEYGVNELRRMFLEFFESKRHLIMKSFSLIPQNDNSLLLINSGMAPMKPYFTGAVIPPSKRVTTCQKCIRTGDIENVGKTSRHGTFFEMLGNFSFGDYFKKEAINFSWEFLTEVVGLDENRLYPSIYQDDEEAFEIWNKDIKIPADRIFRFGKADNFWEHGAGPCGPCSEIYYDRGEKYGCGDPGCTVGCECDRYIEIWNNVFTQFESDGAGNYTELVQKNIDTGMGLERLAVVVQDVGSIFDIDTIKALRDNVCQLAGKKYNENTSHDISIRLITDHIRSSTFMISDGIMPTNEGRGYVLRRLIRRAARHGHLLGIQKGFLKILAETVIDSAKDGYPELYDKRKFILQVLEMEEAKFNKTLEQGLNILEDMIKGVKNGVLSGDDAFKLYDTYGFPIELTKEILDEHKISIDQDGFRENMEIQRKKAREARAVSNYMGADTTAYDLLDAAVESRFVGYDRLENEGKIIGIVGENSLLDTISEGEEGSIIVDSTCFYATMGGQEGDSGYITTENSSFRVNSCIKVSDNKIAHIGSVVNGMFSLNDCVRLSVDTEKRNATCKNHSATHLLHKALKEVLGGHVEQKGSLVTDSRLRFDFSHFSAMTEEELKKVEDLVNGEIDKRLDVRTDIMGLDDARSRGAAALFGEKYTDEVRVVSMGDFSMELCGGTHTSNTGEIGRIKILSESGIASGVRRIEALTGTEVVKYYNNIEDTLNNICAALKCSDDVAYEKLKNILSENKALKDEIENLKNQNAKAMLGNIKDRVKNINGVNVLVEELKGLDMNSIRNVADDIKNSLKDAVIVLGSSFDDKTGLFVSVSKGLESKVSAKNLIKKIAPLIKGGGGGNDLSAQAGGKDAGGLNAALSEALKSINELL